MTAVKTGNHHGHTHITEVSSVAQRRNQTLGVLIPESKEKRENRKIVAVAGIPDPAFKERREARRKEMNTARDCDLELSGSSSIPDEAMHTEVKNAVERLKRPSHPSVSVPKNKWLHWSMYLVALVVLPCNHPATAASFQKLEDGLLVRGGDASSSPGYSVASCSGSA